MSSDPTPEDPNKTEPGEVTYPTLGSYRLLNLLGEGGMGRVYLAKHLVSGAAVALKVIRPELGINRSAVRRFIAEARTVSRVGHPNIVRVLDVAEPSSGEGPLYYAMEYLTGIDLRRELQAGSMLLPRAVDIGLQICEALQAVHDAGVIHRDLKPANIFLIGQEDGRDLVKVLDFGLAKLESGDAGGNATSVTTSGHLLGTPAYMSPEQAAGDRASRQSDVYALGVILFEMFTGRRPFEASSFGGHVVQHLTTRPIPPTTFSPPGAPLPAEVDRIVLRCLEKQPSRRYESAAALGGDLRQLLPRRTVRPSMVVGPARPGFGTGHRTTIGAVALSAVGGVIAVAIYALMGSSPAPAPEAEPAAVPAPAVHAPASAPSADAGPSATSTTEPDGAPPSRPRSARRPRPAATAKIVIEKPAPARKQAREARNPSAEKQSEKKQSEKQQSEKQENLDHVTMDPF